MNDQRQATQLTFFSAQLPQWETLSLETQQAILDVLSQLLTQLIALEPESNTHAEQKNRSC
jgi:hypothetical protein